MTLEKLKQMQRELTRHDYRYYILCQQTITDQQYDKLDHEFEAATWEYLEEIVGKHTRSLESVDDYPDWVRKEFSENT